MTTQTTPQQLSRYARRAIDTFHDISRNCALIVSGLRQLAPLLDSLDRGYLDLSPLERKRLRGRARYLRAYRNRALSKNHR